MAVSRVDWTRRSGIRQNVRAMLRIAIVILKIGLSMQACVLSRILLDIVYYLSCSCIKLQVVENAYLSLDLC